MKQTEGRQMAYRRVCVFEQNGGPKSETIETEKKPDTNIP